MLAIQTQQLNSIFERIVKDKNGVLVRIRFMIVETNGVIKPQIVSIEPLKFAEQSKSQAKAQAVCCLPSPLPKVDVTFSYTKAAPKADYSFDAFFFFNSQPTRAPSF